MESTLKPNPAHSMIPVRPVIPVAAYIGGKRQLAKTLVPMIDGTPHQCYVEPFIGMGGIFFRRRSQPKSEIINDISRDVATLFRILQRHYPQFLDTLKFQITSRTEFERLRSVDPDTLTDLERAARFLYLQRLAFGGEVAGRTFGTKTTGTARFDLTKLVPLLEDVHERLSGVVIERLDWQDAIGRYDRPHTLFYIDPPYWDCESYYGTGVFTKDDFTQMADMLAQIKGRFILSINDAPAIREIFAKFGIREATLTYTAAGNSNAKAVTELIISNSRDG